MNLSEGILKEVLHLMYEKGHSLSMIQKVTVLSFDEIYVSKKIEIDRKLEQIVGPHKTTQIGMARGLFHNWRQPIYYKHDQPLTTENLEDIICKLWDIGYIVVAVVTDLGGGNPQAFKTYNIGIDENEQCFFKHPKNADHKILVFSDAPHDLKLFRNHFIDTGFIIEEDGIEKHINKKVIEELIMLNSKNDLKVAFKIDREHLDVVGAKRQNVSKAAKLISKTVAQAINWCGENGLLTYEDWKTAAEIIKLINDWFDIFNSKVPFNYKIGKEPYGKNLTHQNSILERVTKFMKKVKIGNHKTLLPFQKGFILNNMSIQQMLSYLKKTFNTDDFVIEYILTTRLNQDCLENLFSYLRAMGLMYDHPSPLSLRYRLKWYILGKHSEVILSPDSKNVEDDKTPALVDFNDKSTPLMKLSLDNSENNENDVFNHGLADEFSYRFLQYEPNDNIKDVTEKEINGMH